jgi:hypothetical protein
MTWPTGLNKVINLAQTIRQTFHQVQAAPVLGEDISGFDEHRDFWRAIHNLNQERARKQPQRQSGCGAVA